MAKKESKKRDTQLNRKFNKQDIERWQECANKETNGILTLWIENKLNSEIPKTINEYLVRW